MHANQKDSLEMHVISAVFVSVNHCEYSAVQYAVCVNSVVSAYTVSLAVSINVRDICV